eukprot:m.109276 g.109276  ORF g.109276 m.109276 type:complete len:421 (-) comp27940_c1_seq2:425-1687(-)
MIDCVHEVIALGVIAISLIGLHNCNCIDTIMVYPLWTWLGTKAAAYTIAATTFGTVAYVIRQRVASHSRFEVTCCDVNAADSTKAMRDTISKESYQWPWWCLLDSSGNLVTLLGALRSRRACATKGLVQFDREILTLDCDGVVALDWHSDKTENPEAIVLMHHGLCGSANSSYIQSLLRYLKEKRPSWQSVVLIARGCGELPLTSSHGFTAARTTDFEHALKRIKEQHSNTPVFAIGFSLGAGIIGKYLGESGEASGIDGALLMSVSWNYNKAPYWFWIWSKVLVQGLGRWLAKHSDALKHHVDVEQACRATTIREFDSIVVCGRYDYEKVEDYYHDASPFKTAHRISTPTLAVMAADDPVCCIETIHCATNQGYGSGLVTLVTGTGGHTAWPLADTTECESFADVICLKWLDECVARMK